MVGIMTNKIVVLAGFSGAGKSVLAKAIASTYGCEVVSVGGILRENAKSENRTLPTYLLRHGIKRAFEESRGLILSDTMQKLEKTSVVIDGMYDYEFFKIVENKFGNDNLLVVGFGGGMMERMKRLRLSGKGLFNIFGDIPKIYVGAKKVMSKTSLSVVNAVSPNVAFLACQKRLNEFLMQPIKNGMTN